MKEIELNGKLESLDIIARHHFGISIISLTTEDAIKLRSEIHEWLTQRGREVPQGAPQNQIKEGEAWT
jgi:hypothetical protein